MKIMTCRYAGLIAAVDNYEQTGVPLVYGNSDQIFGCMGMDDIGSYYFIPKLVHIFGLELDTAINLFYIGIAVLSFAIGAVAIWRYCKTGLGKVISFMALVLLSSLIVKVGDVYVALGATAMALVPLWLCIHERGSVRTLVIYCFLGGIVIGVAHFIRSHAGTGVLVFTITSLLLTRRYSLKHKIAYATILLAGIFVVFMYFGHVTQQRDNYYYSKMGSAYQAPVNHHPFWHAVYLGFGFLNNEHGIIFRDGKAKAKVASIDPDVRPFSREYDTILRDQVLSLIKNDPRFVLITIFAKLGVCVMYLVIFSNLGLLLSVYFPRPREFIITFALGIFFNASFGVLVMPHVPYLLGMITFATIYGALSIDFALQKGLLYRLGAQLSDHRIGKDSGTN